MTHDEEQSTKPEVQSARPLEGYSRSSLVTRHSSLFLASSNPGKVREFRDAASVRGVTVEALPGFADMNECDEDGPTFAENARKKAIHYSRNAPGWVFADDSGICVDALDGAPGVYSARFAGRLATDVQNNQRLLAEIHQAEVGARHGVPLHAPGVLQKAPGVSPQSPFDRSAHYICVIALAEAGRVITAVEGRADGVIIDEPRGAGGFGYDPYFFFPPLGKTFAEMLPEEKFTVSHRGAAFRKLLDYLSALG